MKELTMDEKMALLAEVNKLLATIPDYQITMPAIEMEHDDILTTDKVYIKRYCIDHGEICEKFLGETREEAIASLAHGRIVSYGYELFQPWRQWSWEKSNPRLEKYKCFCSYCDSYIFKNIDQASLIYLITDSPALDAINQKAAAVLQKITAYDVPLIRLENNTTINTSCSQHVWWYKKEGERWLYCTVEQGEVHMSIYAENDDEMVFNTVYRRLANYAMWHFVLLRECNGKNPYRKFDDFMEECLRIVYPEHRYQRPHEYDDQKYKELDADYLKGASPSGKS